MTTTHGPQACGDYHPYPASASEGTLKEARRLRNVWNAATMRRDRDPTDVAIAEADRTHDQLLDFIDANELTLTRLDPRGPDIEVEW